jgi:hypothetical protein
MLTKTLSPLGRCGGITTDSSDFGDLPKAGQWMSDHSPVVGTSGRMPSL